MSTGLKEPKRAAAKRDVASHDEGAQSPSLSEAHFPFSGIHDRLTEYREILCRELTQRRADPSSFKGQGIESLLGEVTAQIAQKIETAIAACPPNELSKLKQAISNATLLNGDKLLSGLSFTNRSEDDLRSTSFKEWRARIDGEIRTRLVVGDASEKGIKDSLAGILMSEDLRSMLCGTEGYQWASEIFSQGRMLKAHKLTSATCKKVGVSFKDIKWEACFPGTTEELEDLSKKIRDPRYKGLGGYVAFSDEHADGDMQKGYLLMSALCKFQKVNFASELGWEAAFHGTTGQFETLRKELSNDSYKGLDGYVDFSKEHADGDMKKGYLLMSALCKFQKVNFASELGWEAQFQGTTGQFETLRKELSNDSYKGLDGYVAFSKEHADGDMKKGYMLMSALCKFQKVNFASELGWEAAFLGTTGQFETLRKEVSNDSFKGLDGYVAFSKEHANGDMQKGYQLMSALCKYEGVDFEHVLKWPPQFAGTANQYTFIQQSLLEHAEELAALQKVSKDSRLVALHQVLQMIRGGEVIADLPLSALFAALPEKVSTLARGDFSPACLRLVVGVGEAQQTVYFDSAPERICGYLLHRYGLIKSFVEKENLHVRPSQSSRITLDFKVFGRDGEPVFIEYHPLSRSDQAEGINLEEAGRRKKESVTDGAFSEATVHHIWELEQLFSVLGVCDANFAHSFKQFLEDIKEAKALGRKLDQEDKQQLAVVLEGISIKIIGTGSRPLS